MCITRNTSDFFQYSSETFNSECPRDWFLLKYSGAGNQ
jgi:hypothetical protein